MSVIVTKKNADGSFDNVGMNNRRSMDLKTERGVMNRCVRTGFAKAGDTLRMEWTCGTTSRRVIHHTNAPKDIFISRSRPLEELVGINRRVIRYKLGNLHVSHTLRAALKHARPNGMRNGKCTVALRRGWVLCVIQTWREYQNTYCTVMSGRSS